MGDHLSKYSGRLFALLAWRNKSRDYRIPAIETLNDLVIKLEEEKNIHEIIKHYILIALKDYDVKIEKLKPEEASKIKKLVEQARDELKRMKSEDNEVIVPETEKKSIPDIKKELLKIEKQINDNKIDKSNFENKLHILTAYIQKIANASKVRLKEKEKIDISFLILRLYVELSNENEKVNQKIGNQTKVSKEEVSEENTQTIVKEKPKPSNKNKSETQKDEKNLRINLPVSLTKTEYKEREIENNKNGVFDATDEKSSLVNLSHNRTGENILDGTVIIQINNKGKENTELESEVHDLDDEKNTRECNTNNVSKEEMDQSSQKSLSILEDHRVNIGNELPHINDKTHIIENNEEVCVISAELTEHENIMKNFSQNIVLEEENQQLKYNTKPSDLHSPKTQLLFLTSNNTNDLDQVEAFDKNLEVSRETSHKNNEGTIQKQQIREKTRISKVDEKQVDNFARDRSERHQENIKILDVKLNDIIIESSKNSLDDKFEDKFEDITEIGLSHLKHVKTNEENLPSNIPAKQVLEQFDAIGEEENIYQIIKDYILIAAKDYDVKIEKLKTKEAFEIKNLVEQAKKKLRRMKSENSYAKMPETAKINVPDIKKELLKIEKQVNNNEIEKSEFGNKLKIVIAYIKQIDSSRERLDEKENVNIAILVLRLYVELSNEKENVNQKSSKQTELSKKEFFENNSGIIVNEKLKSSNESNPELQTDEKILKSNLAVTLTKTEQKIENNENDVFATTEEKSPLLNLTHDRTSEKMSDDTPITQINNKRNENMKLESEVLDLDDEKNAWECNTNNVSREEMEQSSKQCSSISRYYPTNIENELPYIQDKTRTIDENTEEFDVISAKLTDQATIMNNLTQNIELEEENKLLKYNTKPSVSDLLCQKAQLLLSTSDNINDFDQEKAFDINLEVGRETSHKKYEGRIPKQQVTVSKVDEERVDNFTSKYSERQEEEIKILVKTEPALDVEPHDMITESSKNLLDYKFEDISTTATTEITTSYLKLVKTNEEDFASNIPSKIPVLEHFDDTINSRKSIASQIQQEDFHKHFERFQKILQSTTEELNKCENTIEELQTCDDEIIFATEKQINDLIEIHLKEITTEFLEIVEQKNLIYNKAVELKDTLNTSKIKRFNKHMSLLAEYETEITHIPHSRDNFAIKKANLDAIKTKVYAIGNNFSEINKRKTTILNSLEGVILFELTNYLRRLSETINTETLNAEQFPFPTRIDNYDSRRKKIQELKDTLKELPQEYPCIRAHIACMTKNIDGILTILDYKGTYNEKVFSGLELLDKIKNEINVINSGLNVGMSITLRDLNKCRKDIINVDDDDHQRIKLKKAEIYNELHRVESDIFINHVLLEEEKNKLNQLEDEIHNFDYKTSSEDYQKKSQEIGDLREKVKIQDETNRNLENIIFVETADTILRNLEKLFEKSEEYGQSHKRLEEIRKKISGYAVYSAEKQKQYLEKDEMSLNSINKSYHDVELRNKIKVLVTIIKRKKCNLALIEKRIRLNNLLDCVKKVVFPVSHDEFKKLLDELLSLKQYVDEQPQGDPELDAQKREFLRLLAGCLEFLDEFVAKLVSSKNQPDTILELNDYFDYDLDSFQASRNSVEFVQKIKSRAEKFEASVKCYLGTNYSVDYYIIYENLVRLLQELHKVVCAKEQEDLLTELVECMDYVKGLIWLLNVNSTDE